MKQGRADRKGPTGQKVEPNAKGVNPGAVSYLGNQLGNHSTDASGDFQLRKTPWRTQSYNPTGSTTPGKTGWDGSAPASNHKTNPKGSQGKY